jgi:hypothetical protein
MVSTVAVVAAANESGPFAGHDLFANMVTLQAFNGSTALTALVLAAIIAERNRAYTHIESAGTQLTGLIGRLDRDRTGTEQRVAAPPPVAPRVRGERSVRRTKAAPVALRWSA